jgi:c-di-GMP-binding flagellar brake protein YcgR
VSAAADQRRFPRLPVRVPLFVVMHGDVMRKRVRIESRDVSGGGLCFETSKELPLEAESRLVISGLSDLPDEAAIECRVARCGIDPATGRYVIGLEFTGFRGVTREELLARFAVWEGGGAPS